MNIFQRIYKLLGVETDKTEVFKLIENARTEYLIVLNNIESNLTAGELYGQANVIKSIAENLLNNDYLKFIEEINSINMWGGSGAVWEVYFHNEDSQRRFHFDMLELIKLMEKTKILGNGIKPLRKLFKKELSK
ncbi:hypothetical protein FCR2A7T_29750 [Flavobacterium cauense R2A-7]|uniref:Uncharacterized protein n=1 Tax=Flavobacterium cauense R2A-7 TaxID=1341154 RepID=V6RW92_9FLAO|nr:hypothetical protein [Flavobacterium cauense]ESU18449.1 hypothetical protein FCR2A7T_29750 [Flavobacterium cauense R2A-7]KGO79444.1 hypothetical protein Q762_14165 [Flavobacterium cauense R2A-7]TWI08107.1 hypothetical protein IP98_02864 [Flavobacterium cauense R2A-7]